MKSSVATAITATAALAIAAMHTPQANAGTSASNATGMCQSALPVFDTQIRKRPLGVNNEGGSSAFVSCSIPIGYNPASIDNAVIYMTNRSAAPVAVSCTMVDGALTTATYYPKLIALAPDTPSALIWEPDEFGLTSFGVYQNYSCSLPPGVELNLLGHDYTDSP